MSPSHEAVIRRRRLASSEGSSVRRSRSQQRKRPIRLALPASGLEEVRHGQERTRTISECRREADRIRLGTRQKLDELMVWNGIEEMSESVQYLILNAPCARDGPVVSSNGKSAPQGANQRKCGADVCEGEFFRTSPNPG